MKQWRLIALSSAGSALEYYDFVIYVMLATYISRVFFPTHDQLSAILSTLGVFAVGYVARPLGGIVFGHIGDTWGRKSAFTIAIMIMALSTLAIGLLPSYQSWGIVSPLLLVICRIAQGISQGAELPGAITFLCEHAKDGRRGVTAGWMFGGVGLGAALAALVNSVLTANLTEFQMDAWGWRVPFLLGALLAVCGWWLRRRAQETPCFEALTQGRELPLTYLLEHHWRQVVRAIGVLLYPACVIIFALFLPAYLTHHFGYADSQVFVAMTVSLVWSACLLPLTGALSDFLGRKRMLQLVCVVSLLLGYPLFQLLNLESTLALWLFMLVYQTLVAGFAGAYPAFLAESFSTSVRYSGVGLAYNLTFTLAAFMPMLAAKVLSYGGQYTFLWLFLGLAAVMMVSLALGRDKSTEVL